MMSISLDGLSEKEFALIEEASAFSSTIELRHVELIRNPIYEGIRKSTEITSTYSS